MTPDVRAVVDRYLERADVEGLYLEGSAALGDHRPGVSDIDFIAVCDSVDLAELRRWHAGLPKFDGVYVTWDHLARDPAEAGDVPTVHDGRIALAAPNPVTWHTLAQHRLVCRGPEDFPLWADEDVLARWLDANLDDYWARWVRRAGHWALTGYGTVWGVTGVSRIHHTLATGRIVSKEAAAVHALAAFDGRWHRVVHESLRLRRGQGGRSLYRSRSARRRDVLAFVEAGIAEGHRVYASR